jgi:hypothetical protein
VQRFKDILSRIKKLEDRAGSDDRVVVVLLENGKECKRNLSVYEASMLALKQDTARMFGLVEEIPSRIIRVEYGDDDGFISALIEGTEKIDPKDAESIIEV